MARPRQLLGLALHGEIQQQGPQLQYLGAADHHTIEPVATAEALLLQTPVTAEQQFAVVGLQLLGGQPLGQRRGEGEGRLDATTRRASAQQAGPLAALGTTEQGIEGIEQDRFAGAGLAGEHGETRLKGELEPLDQGDVLEVQTGKHGGRRGRTRP